MMSSLTYDQITTMALLGGVLILLVWGRWRYDLVAFGALVLAVILKVVEPGDAFAGFGHPATVIIALVLVVSYGLSSSGAVDFIARKLTSAGRSVSTHIAIMATVGGVLSGFMNNVGALALLMPVDIEAARKAKRSPAKTLMPLSFATILGGLVTLIGTPPNIIISTYRERELADRGAFQMFDFAPVGVVCALVGIAFIALIGWRLIPQGKNRASSDEKAFHLDDYLAELAITDGSSLKGISLVDLEKICKTNDVDLLGVIRENQRLQPHAGWIQIREGDVLLVETAAETLDKFVAEHKLSFVTQELHREQLEDAELELTEVVVRPGAAIEGRSSTSMHLIDRYGIWLTGIQRQGRRIQTRVRKTSIQAGDVLLLLGPSERTKAFSELAGLLPLAKRGLEVSNSSKAALAAGIFAGAIALSSVGLLYLPIALALVAVLYVLIGIVPLKQIYETIEWPVVILIGSLIPIGLALENSGATRVLVVELHNLVVGLDTWIVLLIVMVLTMTLSDVLNNTATALVAAPIAHQLADKLGANPDAFLMGVAVAASCAFLTPIGHKNNTLIMGPGGYRFGDYWRMGLPLEIVVIAVAVPTIMVVWP